MAASKSMTAKSLGLAAGGDVVEIGLLLPSAWADALLEISKRRRESVGQIIRSMIDRGLVDDLMSDV